MTQIKNPDGKLFEEKPDAQVGFIRINNKWF